MAMDILRPVLACRVSPLGCVLSALRPRRDEEDSPEVLAQVQEATEAYEFAVESYRNGQLEEGLRHAELAVQVFQTVRGNRDPDYARSINILALIHKAMGNFDLAYPLCEETRELVLEIVGSRHPDYAGTLNNLAALHKSMGDFSKSEPLFLEVRDIILETVGRKSNEYATSVYNLAQLYKLMGILDKAEEKFLELTSLIAEMVGRKHPNYTSSLDTLATLYISTGDFEKAESLYQEAKEILHEALGTQSASYKKCLARLQTLHTLMGTGEEADHGVNHLVLPMAERVPTDLISEPPAELHQKPGGQQPLQSQKQQLQPAVRKPQPDDDTVSLYSELPPEDHNKVSNTNASSKGRQALPAAPSSQPTTGRSSLQNAFRKPSQQPQPDDDNVSLYSEAPPEEGGGIQQPTSRASAAAKAPPPPTDKFAPAGPSMPAASSLAGRSSQHVRKPSQQPQADDDSVSLYSQAPPKARPDTQPGQQTSSAAKAPPKATHQFAPAQRVPLVSGSHPASWRQQPTLQPRYDDDSVSLSSEVPPEEQKPPVKKLDDFEEMSEPGDEGPRAPAVKHYSMKL